MTLTRIFAVLGMVVASAGTIGTADAQRRDHDRGRYEQRDHRGDYRNVRHDRGNHYGRDRHDRCRTIVRHHRRVRVCR